MAPHTTRPGPQPQKQDRVAYWHWLAAWCARLAELVPYGIEPEYIQDSSPEWRSSARAERASIEEQLAEPAREAIRKFLEKCVWPDTSPEVAFLAQCRLSFARRFALACAETGDAGPSAPAGTPILAIGWMLLELYDGEHFYQCRWAADVRDAWG